SSTAHEAAANQGQPHCTDPKRPTYQTRKAMMNLRLMTAALLALGSCTNKAAVSCSDFGQQLLGLRPAGRWVHRSRGLSVTGTITKRERAKRNKAKAVAKASRRRNRR